MRQRPFALIGAGLVVDAVIDAGVAQILVGAGEALAELFGPQFVQRLDEVLPDRAGIARCIDHLVDDAVDRLVVLQQTVDLRLAAYPLVIPLAIADQSLGGRRRSRVIGKSSAACSSRST